MGMCFQLITEAQEAEGCSNMKKKLSLLALLFMLIFSVPEVAIAQTPQPSVTLIDGTTPVSSLTHDALQNYLDQFAPYPAPYYAATSINDEGTDQLISLVALNLASPNDPWSMERHDGDTSPSPVVWAGTIKLYPDGNGVPYSTDPPQSYAPHLAMIMPSILQAGGGSYVSFPFDKSAMYGPRGVHGSGDYGTSGMVAVDLVGGASLGSNVMSDHVYASDTGTIDYVCNDGTSVAVRTYNSSTGDYFLYAHLLDNANLTNGTAFTKGAVIGSLKHGTFNDSCGWAEQDPDIYHVHWMFTPTSGSFRAENYTLNTSDQKWYNGNTAIGTGGWLQNTYIVGGGGDNPTGSTQAPSFWDNIVNAIVAFVSTTLAPLPEHTSPTDLLRMLVNGIDLVFRLTYVFARGNLNLVPMFIIIGIVLIFRLLLSVFWVIWWVVRALYNIIPGAA